MYPKCEGSKHTEIPISYSLLKVPLPGTALPVCPPPGFAVLPVSLACLAGKCCFCARLAPGGYNTLKKCQNTGRSEMSTWSLSSLFQEHIHKYVQEHVKAAYREEFLLELTLLELSLARFHPRTEQEALLLEVWDAWLLRMLCSSALTTPHSEHRAEAAEQGPCKFTTCQCVLTGKMDAQGVLR